MTTPYKRLNAFYELLGKISLDLAKIMDVDRVDFLLLRQKLIIELETILDKKHTYTRPQTEITQPTLKEILGMSLPLRPRKELVELEENLKTLLHGLQSITPRPPIPIEDDTSHLRGADLAAGTQKEIHFDYQIELKGWNQAVGQWRTEMSQRTHQLFNITRTFPQNSFQTELFPEHRK